MHWIERVVAVAVLAWVLLQPTANDEASLAATLNAGPFHRMISPTTPTDSRIV